MGFLFASGECAVEIYKFICENGISALFREESKSDKGESNLLQKDTPWMDFAMKEYNKGVAETKGKTDNNPRIIEYLKNAGLSGDYLKDETAWCAAFVNWCLDQSGINGAGAKGAEWKIWGQELTGPTFGAIAIFNTNHIGFVVGMNGDKLIIFHGNWTVAISLSDYISPNQICGYRYPNGYLPKKFP